jgi:hypothetical protein
VFDVRARGAAGEWRAPRMALKREGARASVGESIEWLRSPRSTKTVAAKRPNFKVGASLALPVVDDGEQWDGEAASAGVFEASGLNTPWSDGFLARKAHLVYDASAPHLKSSYRFLFARIIDGVLTADREGLNLDELGDEVEPLTLSEPRQSLALRFDPQTGSPLLVGADTDVSDDRLDGGLDCVLILYTPSFWDVLSVDRLVPLHPFCEAAEHLRSRLRVRRETAVGQAADDLGLPRRWDGPVT